MIFHLLTNPVRIVTALQSGDALAIRRAFNPIFESLVATTPYIFAGLAVALGFRTGLFNIGAEGQIFMGAIFSAYVGYAFTGLPAKGMHWVARLPCGKLVGRQIAHALNGRIGADEDREVQAGSVVYVAKTVEHRFHSIEEELRVLVFFAPAEYSRAM